ncbi:MAG TPA: NADH-quinone oxidoreductase subunit NuoF [Bacillota bacterium]|jgi:NADP-reducing hydrogenase subunit HndC|nr:NADH-quinone oxidoreductase subunit NuoF [Bacillota bacterium]HOB86606.1 NADH-quinone oxidoreductase subunit NuoF [Bacillota bacterium]HOP69099.1 NADH-quinone oxidoreductase subunit NuoF [Bacillota bacterium]HPT34294.1 NADH-quinone oxidoreductase subunit NuoF [Bacillota bacterium]
MTTLWEEIAAERIPPEAEHRILLCGGVPCTSLGCKKVKEALEQELESNGLKEQVPVKEVGCIGDCSLGPSLIVYPEGIIYYRLRPEDAATIVREHIIQGRVVEELLHRDPDTEERFRQQAEMPYYRSQVRLVLRNCGVVPPHIEEYMKYRGYAALARALAEMTPEQVIEEVKNSGLRGRGGGGFPTGLKWELTRAAPGESKYVICNGDEGDPGAFMDRSILEGDPHSVLEGMIIAGYAVGASQGLIYVRAEYPQAVRRSQEAIAEARKMNFLGENILELGFNFDIEVRIGAGAFVCGEETALITSVEGTRGDPGPRPPFPAQKGLWGLPTLINNVETLANIPLIILHGAERFKELGRPGNSGTKVFALAGKVKHTGLVEVPLGTPLRTLVYDIGGGIPGGKRFKAAQTGGPSGGCLGEEYLDIPMDYDSLAQAGSMMGSGGLIIMDEDTCMVDIARFYLDFTQDESCGKCTPCRVGTKRMLEILERITRGRGEEEDLERLYQLSMLLKNGSLCGLGRSAPNPVLSTLRHFKDEYLAHIREGYCPAGVCTALNRPRILEEKCRSCGLCARVCPAAAITGEKGVPYRIDPALCNACRQCIEECPFNAIATGGVQHAHADHR